MRAICLVVGFCTLATSIQAKDPVKILSLEAQSDEEMFLVRRIAEFWKDKDYQIVQSQIVTFLEKFPDSSLRQPLHGVLGDLYVQKDQYDRALDAYNTISDQDVYEKILINKLQCYYELGQYGAIAKEGERYLSHPTASIDERRDEFHFLMAEAFFRPMLTTENLEKKAELATRAKPLFETLGNSPYADLSQFALAEIYRTLGAYPDSAELYLQLSERYPDQKEELLFHAANLQAQFKPELAAMTFSDIIAMQGTRVGEATFNRTLVYYQLGKYEDVIEAYDQVKAYIPEDKQPVFHLIIGKSYFSTEDYGNAIYHLKEYLVQTTSVNPSSKNAELMLMTASYHQGDSTLFNQTFDRFKLEHPEDPELPKAIFTHAMLAKASGDTQQVQQDLETLMTQYPNYIDQEGLLFEYASLTYEHQDWAKSYDAFQHFLTSYPESDRNSVAWRYYFSSVLNLYKKAQDNEEITYSKSAFYNDIALVLDQEGILGNEEMREYRLLEAKTAYELDQFTTAYEKLSAYIDDYANDPTLSEAHFIAGLASKEINHDLKPVCAHFEKALELGSDLYDTASLHLELYNAYLTLSTYDANQAGYLTKAASHLYEAVAKDTQPIKAENRLWLANHFYEDKSDAALERSYKLFKDTLTVEDSLEIAAIDQNCLFLEAEVLKLAELLDKKQDYKAKTKLLKSLASYQNANASWNWQFQRHTLLELAKTYEQSGNREQALSTYGFIAETAKYSPSPLSFVALLQEARLRYEDMPKKNKREDHPDVIRVLNNLKELQIKKHVATEPTHIEAAIDYASIRADLAQKEETTCRHLFFLQRVKEDFSLTDDQISQDYYAGLQENPEKNHLFQLYMQLVDGQIACLEAKTAADLGHVKEAQTKAVSAKRLLSDLGNDPRATDYLKKHATKAIKSIDNLGV